jgi:tRNA(Ile)-lysidine synthase
VRKPSSSVRAAKTFDLNQLFEPIKNVRSVAVAVSGGSDSMALLLLAQDYALAFGQYLVAITIDHGLRPEAKAEVLQVRAWCKAHGIDHLIKHWVGPKPTTGIQAAARVARYDALTDCCMELDIDVLLTGHTANDQAETVFMRKQRTDSAHSLAGIWPELNWAGTRVVRPLLGVTRQQLRDYLVARMQGWIEDPSNDDEKFERVRVRKSLPLATIHQYTEEARLNFARHVSAESRMRKWMGLVEKDHYGVISFPIEPLVAFEEAAQVLALKRALGRFGYGGGDGGALLRMAQWIARPGNSQRTLGGVVFVKRATRVMLVAELGRMIADPWPVPESGRVHWDYRIWLEAPPGSLVMPAGVVDGIARRKEVLAVVQDTLPAVILPDGAICVPHLGIGSGARVLERKNSV